MIGKKISESKVQMSYRMSSLDANPSGNVLAGAIMRLMDTAANVVAVRHARANVVTAAIDRLDFHTPVYSGDFITIFACVNYVHRTSMEIGLRIEAEDLVSGYRRHTASAYMTYVALDSNGHPMPVPPLILETEEEHRRHRQGQARREQRLAERTKEKACRQDLNECPA